MAERVGFEPTLPFRVNTLSKRAPSATRPSLRRHRWEDVRKNCSLRGSATKFLLILWVKAKNRNLRARLTAVLWRDLGLRVRRLAKHYLMTSRPRRRRSRRRLQAPAEVGLWC